MSQGLKPVPYRCPALFRMCVTFSSPHSSQSWTPARLEPLCCPPPQPELREPQNPNETILGASGGRGRSPGPSSPGTSPPGHVGCLLPRPLPALWALPGPVWKHGSVWLSVRYQETKHGLPGAPCPSSAPGSMCESKATCPLSLQTRSPAGCTKVRTKCRLPAAGRALPSVGAGRGLLCGLSWGLLPTFLATNVRVIPGPGVGTFSLEAGGH